MPDTCAALGCLNRRGKDCDVGFFRFPSPKLQGPRRKRWAAALRRFNDDGTPWEPTSASRICGDHFYTGRPQRARGHPDHVPSIFRDRPARDSVWRQLNGVEGSHTELQAPGLSAGVQAGTDTSSTDEKDDKLNARCVTDNENHEKLDACGTSDGGVLHSGDGENHEKLDATSPVELPATSRLRERNPAKADQLPSIGNNMAGDAPCSGDSGSGTRRLGPRVSPRQMEMLMEFLDEHPYLASTSREKGRGVKVFERELLWEEAAGKLNAKGPAIKSRSSWRKFWCSRSEQIQRTVARVAKMREESKQLPRAPPPPPPPLAPHPVAAEQGQLLLLLKQNGPCQPQRLLLPRLQQQQVQLQLGTPGEAASVFVSAAGSPLPAAGVVHAQGTTPLGSANGALLEQAGGVGSGPPEPDTRPPAVGTEEHFHSQMLHQTSQQTALLQGLLEEQRRMAEAAERQARALEEQSHAVSQLLLLMMGNQRHAAAEAPIALTPDMVQVQHAPSAS